MWAQASLTMTTHKHYSQWTAIKVILCTALAVTLCGKCIIPPFQLPNQLYVACMHPGWGHLLGILLETPRCPPRRLCRQKFEVFQGAHSCQGIPAQCSF